MRQKRHCGAAMEVGWRVVKQAPEVMWGPIAPGTSGRQREVNEMRAATSPCGIGNARRWTVRSERVAAGQVV